MTRRPGDSASAPATAAPTDTAPDSTALDTTAPDSTAPADTAPDSTAPESTAPAESTTARRRLPALDVLRGIAILGTLLTNIWIFSGSGLHRDDA